MATKKKKTSTKKKSAAKATTARALTAASTASFSGAPLTPNNNKATANTALVAAFSGLSSYWNLFRPETYYRVVVARVVSKDGTTLTFDVIDPANGNTAKSNLTVNLDDGANTYPYFPSTVQQYAGGSSRFGYLLLSEEYLEAQFDPGKVSSLAGPKVPLVLSL